MKYIWTHWFSQVPSWRQRMFLREWSLESYGAWALLDPFMLLVLVPEVRRTRWGNVTHLAAQPSPGGHPHSNGKSNADVTGGRSTRTWAGFYCGSRVANFGLGGCHLRHLRMSCNEHVCLTLVVIQALRAILHHPFAYQKSFIQYVSSSNSSSYDCLSGRVSLKIIFLRGLLVTCQGQKINLWDPKLNRPFVWLWVQWQEPPDENLTGVVYTCMPS